MKNLILTLLLTLGVVGANAQTVPDSCKLRIGTNVAGIVDWSTELPFVDVMKMARSWISENVGPTWPSPDAVWDSQAADSMQYDTDGWPVGLPQDVPGRPYPQTVKTVWADNLGAWPEGVYTCLYDGTGNVRFGGAIAGQQTNVAPGRIEFTISNPAPNGTLIMSLVSSDPIDCVRNIRVLMPGHAETYVEQPFNPLWMERLSAFAAVRFMDWGRTNNWGDVDGLASYDEAEDSIRRPWADRTQPSAYTYTVNTGVPYETMIRLCNVMQRDAWVCIPHNADDDYIRQMARMFRDNLDPTLTVYVEYSNEIWNWGFGQTQWLNRFGCVEQGVSWPEGVVPYIQRAMDLWTEEFEGQMQRTVRVGGVQLGWADVSRRMLLNLEPGTLDAFAGGTYFGLLEQADAQFDALGAAVTVEQMAAAAREAQDAVADRIREHKQTIGDVLGIPLLHYEGGQHLTPNPFGVQPTYAQALLDIQRDPVMYDLYNEWFDTLRTFVDEGERSLFMNFSFVGVRSARYGSWGILETLDQDTSVVPAPKFRAVMEHARLGCEPPRPQIWPGDANNDASVTVEDFFLAAGGYGRSGHPRTEGGVAWQGYPLPTVWSTHAVFQGAWVNDRHLDANGDGAVTLLDVAVAILNRGLSH